MTKDETRRIAAVHGLTKLADAQLEPFAASIENNARLVAGLPGDLHWSDEPAHVVRLPQPREGAR